MFFFLLYLKLDLLQKNSIVTGLVYGAFAWAVMNLLVLPLNPAPPIPFVLKKAAIALLILMFCIGLPNAWMANKHYLYKK